MADDVLASFLVALGFKVDSASQKAAVRSVADYEKAVKEAEKRIEDAKWAAAKSDEDIAKLTRETNLKLAREALEGAKAREKSEQEEARKRKERSDEFVSGLKKAAVAAAAAATAIGYAVAKVAGSFDNLYFQAQRSGTSVQSLKALGYGFSQVGGTAQQAGAAVDSFTTKLRNNPGLRQFVKELGVDDNLQGVDKYIATLDALKNQPRHVGVQYAEMLGISEENYDLFIRQGEALKQYRAEYDAMSRRFGLNSEEAAKASTSFQRSLTRLQATAGVLGEKLMVALAPAIKELIDRFQEWVDANPGVLDKILTDIAKAIVRVATGIGKFLAEIAGGSGDAFLKKWDAFVERAQRFAKTIERIVYGVERLLKLLGFVSASTGTNTVLGDGNRTIAALNAISGGTAAPNGPGGADVSAEVPDNRTFLQKVLPNSMGGKPAPGRAQIGSWWTPERQQHAIDTLTKGGVSELGAKALVARWSAVEAGDGPTSRNPKSGAWGIGQWRSPDRRAPIDGNPDFDAQLAHAVKELQTTERAALAQLNSAKTDQEAARGASMYERAEGYDRKTGLDNFTAKTATAMGLLGRRPAPSPAAAGVTDISDRANYKNGQLDAVKGFIVHHTGGRGSPEGVVDTLNQRRLGVQYVMDRDGKIFQTLPDGARGAHLRPAQNGSGLDNSNSLGMEVIAKDDRDITPAQVASAKAFLAGLERKYPGLKVFGHGEVNAHKQETEGQTIVDAFRKMTTAERAASSAPAADKPPAASPQDRPTVAKPVMNPSGFDPNRIDPQAAIQPAAPMGVSPVSNDNSTSKSVTQHITNHTTISEARNPREAARVMESSLSRVHNLSLANAQSAIA